MTRDETRNIIRMMCAIYPNCKPSNMTDTVDAWSVILKDEEYATIEAALYTYIRENHEFAPSVGQLIQKKDEILNPEINEAEAWAVVYNAMCDSIYNSYYEFAALPREIQRAVGSPEVLKQWAMAEGETVEVIKSNFCRAYRGVLRQEQSLRAMPENLARLTTATLARLEARESKPEVIKLPKQEKELAPEIQEYIDNVKEKLSKLGG